VTERDPGLDPATSNNTRRAALMFATLAAAAPIVQSVAPLTEAQRGELLLHVVRVMLAGFLEAQAR
jgi:hypothetical protein